MTELLMCFAVQATRIIIPIIIILGTVSNSLNIIILTRPALNRYSCSLYFLFLSINNLFYSTILLIINLLGDGYRIDLVTYSSFSCKIISYFLNLCPNISAFLIVLATIDRYCASSIHVRIRMFSNIRFARRTIGLLIVTFTIFFSWALAAFDLEQVALVICSINSKLLSNQIFLIIDIALYVIIAPFCMILFGFLTIKNANTFDFMRQRFSPHRRVEIQLSRMLLLQVGTHIILSLTFCICFILFILQIPLLYTREFYYIYVISKLPLYLTFTTAFFLYTLSAKIYRNELIRLFKKYF